MECHEISNKKKLSRTLGIISIIGLILICLIFIPIYVNVQIILLLKYDYQCMMLDKFVNSEYT